MIAKRTLAYFASAFLMLCALAMFASIEAQEQTPVATILVETRTLGAQIPRDFVGLSLEVSTVGQGIGAFSPGGATPSSSEPVAQYALGTPAAPNAAFFQFMHALGPGILRLGGNSQDNTCFQPASAPQRDWCKGDLTAADLQLFARAVRESGWRLILGINLKQNSSDWALREVAEASKDIKPDQLLGLEIGNEPDLFSRDGSRPQSYSPAAHLKDFVAYRDAFAQDPVAKQYGIVGPATCCSWRNAKDLGDFIDGVGASSLKLATVHNYPLTTCNNRPVTIQQLLAPDLMDRFNTSMQALAAAAQQRHVPLALAETNSASCGGMPGVSNAFAAALWATDTLYSAAKGGLSGVNFHISYRPGGGSSYNPIDTYAQAAAPGRQTYRNIAEPVYYGMYLFAQNASGEYLLPVTMDTGKNIRAYATTACSNCAIHVALLNEDLSAAGTVNLRVTNGAGMARVLLLKAPKLSSPAHDVTYGGAQFGSDGRIAAPQVRQISSDSSGNYSVDLPNSTAAVLTIRPATHSQAAH